MYRNIPEYRAEVSEIEAGSKLFAFCRSHFPQLSKRKLHDKFVSSHVIINGTKVVPSHDDEFKRVRIGDIIEVIDFKDDSIIDKDRHEVFTMLYQGIEGISLLSKPAGTPTKVGSSLDTMAKASLWDGRYNSTMQFLNRPSKSQAGICIVASSMEILDQLRQGLCAGGISLIFRCICAGKIGEIGESRIIDFPVMNIKYEVVVQDLVRSRSVNWLSVVDVIPRFTSSMTCCCYDCDSPLIRLCKHLPKCVYYPSHCLKQITRVLAREGFPVVGDRDIVKSSKGVFAALVGVAFTNDSCLQIADASSSTSTGDGVRFSVDVPGKFAKLLFRESTLFARAVEEDKTKLNAFCTQRERNDVNLTSNDGELYLCKDDAVDSSGDEADEADDADDDSPVSQALSLIPIPASDNNIPVEYQTGIAMFRNIQFHVDSNVMIPRKSSEVLVSIAIEYLTARRRSSATEVHSEARVLDMGTGSGCLLLSLLSGMQSAGLHATGVGVDISPSALTVAISNARRLGLHEQTSFTLCSFASIGSLEVTPMSRLPFDVVLCNPPYSSAKEIGRLSSSRVNCEPHAALFNAEGGPYASYRMIAQALQQLSDDQERASRLLAKGARLFLEVGSGQATIVKGLMAVVSRLTFVAIHNDHKHIPRCLEYVMDI